MEGEVRETAEPWKILLLATCSGAGTVSEVKLRRGAGGIRYPWKSMIMTGIELNKNGRWEV